MWWFTSFLTDSKKQLKKYLAEKNIQTRGFFYPLHLQPCYNNKKVIFSKNGYRDSEQIYNKGISLPSAYILSDEEQDYIINTVIKFYE